MIKKAETMKDLAVMISGDLNPPSVRTNVRELSIDSEPINNRVGLHTSPTKLKHRLDLNNVTFNME